MMDIKKRLEEIVETHEREAFITCDEECLCWDIKALIAEIEASESKCVLCEDGGDCVLCDGGEDEK